MGSTFGSSRIFGITYGSGKFVAVGYDGKMAYTTRVVETMGNCVA